jgi:uncharacterized protein (TIGR03790 family)
MRSVILTLLSLLVWNLRLSALEPADVFLVINNNVPASRDIADHYLAKRGVPKDNVIPLDLPTGEDISRDDYNSKLVKPLRAALKDRQEKVKVLLTIYGVPLRVGGQQPSDDDKKILVEIQPRLAELERSVKLGPDELRCLEHHAKLAPDHIPATAIQEKRDQLKAEQDELIKLKERHHFHSWAESQACVDSELSLLWSDDYELRRFMPNWLYWQVTDKMRRDKPNLIMTCRLDGPTVAIVKGLVDQAVEVETKGLQGKVYVDARKIDYDPKTDLGYQYGGYDESLREMASLLREEAKLDVTLDDEPSLFKPDSCPECALYCGWYSLANYVPCCKFVKGAVAYHIASSEAVSLRNASSKQWCKCLLEDGVAATLGPVAEPYTIGFPKPAEFFGCLATGEYTLVECYHRTALFTSWMTVLVGDPLYKPFGKTPKLKPDQVKPSPAKGRYFLRDE